MKCERLQNIDTKKCTKKDTVSQSNKKGAETGALILNSGLGCRKGPIEPMGERFDITRLDRRSAPDAQA